MRTAGARPGQMLDSGRLPVVTVFAALGFGLAWLAWSSAPDARALLAAFALCLLLAFGRTTFGPLAEVIPGSADIFFRRFMMGGQLAALLLAGRGAAWLAAKCGKLLEARVPQWPAMLSPAAVLVAAVAVLEPAWLQLGAYDRQDAAAIAAQRHADSTQGADLDRLIAVIKRDDDRDLSDYRLFGIRYLIIPARGQPPVRARLAMRSGPYWLWTVGGTGYIQAGRIIGEISANRTNVGARSVRLLRSGLAADGTYLGVRSGSSGGNGAPRPARSHSAAGAVIMEHAGLDDGEASATVRMRQPGVVILSATYDPGWTATVNGQQRPVRMVAPAIAAVDAPAGKDHIVFRFHGYGDYPALLAVSLLTLTMAAAVPRCMRYARRRRAAADSPGDRIRPTAEVLEEGRGPTCLVWTGLRRQ